MTNRGFDGEALEGYRARVPAGHDAGNGGPIAGLDVGGERCICGVPGGSDECPVHVGTPYQAGMNLPVYPSDNLGEPTWWEANGVPMDDGKSRLVPSVDRGFYRTYEAVCQIVRDCEIEMPMQVGDLDAEQLEWELVNEHPVNGQVVFRLVGGRVVAHLVSYTAFC